MNVYIITYDLNRGTKNEYSKLIDAIKGYENWAKITESCWAIKTSFSAKYIRDDLKFYLDEQDRIYVGRLGKEAAWSNVMCTNDWLKKNL